MGARARASECVRACVRACVRGFAAWVAQTYCRCLLHKYTAHSWRWRLVSCIEQCAIVNELATPAVARTSPWPLNRHALRPADSARATLAGVIAVANRWLCTKPSSTETVAPAALMRTAGSGQDSNMNSHESVFV